MTLQPAQPSELSQALIAFGGAIVGGLFVLVGGWTQGRRLQKLGAREASHRAAQRVLLAAAELQGEGVNFGSSGSSESVVFAFNNFSLISISETPFIVDNALSERIRTHVDLMQGIAGFASQGKRLPMGAARRDFASLEESINCHISNKTLPPHSKPPLRDSAALVKWGEATN